MQWFIVVYMSMSLNDTQLISDFKLSYIILSCGMFSFVYMLYVLLLLGWLWLNLHYDAAKLWHLFAFSTIFFCGTASAVLKCDVCIECQTVVKWLLLWLQIHLTIFFCATVFFFALLPLSTALIRHKIRWPL